MLSMKMYAQLQSVKVSPPFIFFTQSQCLASVCLSFFTGNAAI